MWGRQGGLEFTRWEGPPETFSSAHPPSSRRRCRRPDSDVDTVQDGRTGSKKTTPSRRKSPGTTGGWTRLESRGTRKLGQVLIDPVLPEGYGEDEGSSTVNTGDRGLWTGDRKIRGHGFNGTHQGQDIIGEDVGRTGCLIQV